MNRQTNNTGASALTSWLEKASATDLKGRCKLLWTDKNSFCDILIKILNKNGELDKIYPAHKLILAIGSRKFASQLYPEGEDCQDSSITAFDIPFNIEIQDVSAPVMGLIMEFLYTDEIPKASEFDWFQMGGELMSAAKMFEIPRLTEYCENLFENQLSCEEIVSLFSKITALRNEECKWPRQHYQEMLNLCFSYILRNGEVILRCKTFTHLSMNNVESIISSDFLMGEEITIYKALKRWSSEQCKKKGFDSKQINHLRSVLKRSDEDDQSIGLLKHVRFPLIDSETFTLRVHKSSSSLISNQDAERVYKYHAISKPTRLFLEKERISEINETNSDDFKKHIEGLAKVALLRIFTTTAAPETIETSCAKSNNLTDVPSHSQQDNNTSTKMSNSVSKSALKMKYQTSNTSATVDQPLVRSIKKEQDSDGENGPNSSLAVKLEPVSPQVENKTPLRIINQDRHTVIGECDTKPFKRKVIKATTVEEAPTPTKIKKVAANLNISDREGVAVFNSQPDSPKHVARSQSSSQVSEIIVDRDESKNYIINNQKVKYRKMIEDVAKLPLISNLILKNIEIDSNEIKKMEKSCTSVSLPKLKNFVLKANLVNMKKGTLFQNLTSIKMEHLVFCYCYNETSKDRLSDLWTNYVSVKCVLNGVTVLNISSNKNLTINCAQKTPFLNLKFQTLNHIQSLNLGNCALNSTNWLNDEDSEGLAELRFLCVKGCKYSQVFRSCQSLDTLGVWPVENQTPTLCLDDIISKKIRCLSVMGHMIKFHPMSTRIFSSLEEVTFCDCSWDPSLIDMIGSKFPNLRKIFVINRFEPPSSKLLKALLSVKSVREINMWNFDTKSLNEPGYLKLREFVNSLNLRKSLTQLSFNLRREFNAKSEWKGEIMTIKDLTRLIYESFGFEQFFTNDAWLKYFWVNHSYY